MEARDRRRPRGPGLALVAVGLLDALVATADFAATLGWRATHLPEAWSRSEAVALDGWFWSTTVLGALQLAVAAVVVAGGIALAAGRARTLALGACVLAALPVLTPSFVCVPTCCLGLPVGVWGLVALHLPELRPFARR